jgi:hypothetical protein
MELVDYSMKVPKESKEVVDALVGIVKHFKQKKPLAEAVVLLPAVLEAVEGVSGLGEEMKSAYNDEAAGYLLHSLWGALKAEEASE